MQMDAPEMVAPVFAMLMVFIWLTVVLFSIALTLLIWCRLFHKAGFHWALGLLMLVPIANVVMCFYLAFAEWPVHRQLRTLQNQRPA
jgi:hypothetical protein